MKGNKENKGRLRTQKWEIEARNRLCSSLREEARSRDQKSTLHNVAKISDQAWNCLGIV
jgi:hypothetical protein